MKTEQTEKLLELYEAGCIVRISRGYVDGDCHVYEATESTIEENNGFHKTLQLGDICFDSDVFEAMPLKEIEIEDVHVSRPVEDWETVESGDLV